MGYDLYFTLHVYACESYEELLSVLDEKAEILPDDDPRVEQFLSQPCDYGTMEDVFNDEWHRWHTYAEEIVDVSAKLPNIAIEVMVEGEESGDFRRLVAWRDRCQEAWAELVYPTMDPKAFWETEEATA